MNRWTHGKVGILAGGPSCEREVSLVSGKAVFEALTSAGIPCVLIDPIHDFIPALKAEQVRVAFVALHGTFGEDGTVQRLLEHEGIPYTGPGAEASERAFDKSVSQKLLKAARVRVPDFCCLRRGDPIPDALPPYPLVVKPARAGSSVGVAIVKEDEALEPALTEAFRYSEAVLAERYIRGRELTVGVLDESPLPTVEIVVEREFYDYQAKYGPSGTRYLVPADLTAAENAAVQDQAVRAYRILGLEMMSRVDVILGADGLPYVLEINTIPGLTGRSLLPKAAAAAGIDFTSLCVRILKLSLKRAERRYAGRSAEAGGRLPGDLS